MSQNVALDDRTVADVRQRPVEVWICRVHRSAIFIEVAKINGQIESWVLNVQSADEFESADLVRDLVDLDVLEPQLGPFRMRSLCNVAGIRLEQLPDR